MSKKKENISKDKKESVVKKTDNISNENKEVISAEIKEIASDENKEVTSDENKEVVSEENKEVVSKENKEVPSKKSTDSFDWDLYESGDDEYSAEERNKLKVDYEKELSTIITNEVLDGEVVSITDREVIININ